MKQAGGFDWDLLMRFGLGALGIAPRDFWRMTPGEFDAAVKGRVGAFTDGAPMSSARLASLSERYPDRGEAR